jgi:NADH-quinone oxidoreductase subunit L
MHKYIGLALVFPLIGFLINGLFGWRISKEKIIGWIGSLTVGASFVVAFLIYLELLGFPSYERKFIVEYFPWIKVGSFEVSFSYLVDPLSILMALVVTGVGFLIHVYSIGYMHGDRGFARFFAYLNLFIFMMLTLVLADNYLLMFLGWEGVGLCSYLLIGFWYDKPFEKMTTSDAGRKAFIVNRVGDFGFLIGLFLMYKYFGSLNFNTVFSIANKLSVGDTTIFWITLLLFVGATGKSAQIPLYVWLPDAMAGPTPVSALIHAATMVTAGVYMIARSSVLYALAPTTMLIVAIVGALTAVYAASMGLVQNGIKKVLAYSTISQLGYMFLAMGVGTFSAGIFHLTTHAFFKALLFLGAGAVMHALNNEEDIQKMGGLKEHLPITYKTFFIASLAIAGIPPLSGFFSKDEILWGAYSQGSFLLWLLGAVGAFMTAFYMFRLLL